MSTGHEPQYSNKVYMLDELFQEHVFGVTGCKSVGSKFVVQQSHFDLIGSVTLAKCVGNS